MIPLMSALPFSRRWRRPFILFTWRIEIELLSVKNHQMSKDKRMLTIEDKCQKRRSEGRFLVNIFGFEDIPFSALFFYEIVPLFEVIWVSLNMFQISK